MRREAVEQDLDCFHWINEDGLLDVAEWHAIAREVWGKAAQALIDSGGEDD